MLLNVEPEARVLVWRGDPLPRTSRFCHRSSLEAFYGPPSSHYGSRAVLVTNGLMIGFSGYSNVDWAGVGLTTSRVFACMVSETAFALDSQTRNSRPYRESLVFLNKLIQLVGNLGGLFRAVELDLGSVPRSGELAEALNEYNKRLDESRPLKSEKSYAT